MARPLKSGLDFFPIETDIGSDPKITRLIRRGGSDAWTVFTWILILTYREGYYSEKEMVKETIAWNFRDISEERIEECMDIIVDAGLLHRELYDQGILTSHGIQVQYEQILKRRKNNASDMRYWIIVDNNLVNVDNNSVSASNNSVNVDNNTQTENKQKINRKENKINRNQKTENKENHEADFSDSFQSSFSDSLISRLTMAGVDVKQNTLRKVNEWIAEYDPRSIDEAADVAIAKKAKNIVGYMDTVLKGWAQGSGNPKWVEREEMALAEQKKEYMRPGALTRELMTTRKLE